MSEEPRKPIGILIEGDSHSNTFTNVKVVGDMDAVVMRPNNGKSPHNNKFDNLLHIKESTQIEPTSASKRWLEKPFGFIVATIFCGLVVAFCAYYFGWAR